MRVAFKTGLVEPRRNEEGSLSLSLSWLLSNGVLSVVPLSQGGLDILQAVAVHGYYILYAVIIADKRAHRVICAPAASEKRLLATVIRAAYTHTHTHVLVNYVPVSILVPITVWPPFPEKIAPF